MADPLKLSDALLKRKRPPEDEMTETEKLFWNSVDNPVPAKEFEAPEIQMISKAPLCAYYDTNEGKMKMGMDFSAMNVHLDKRLPDIKKSAVEYLNDTSMFDSGKGFYFWGEPGSGKTLLACIIANLLHERNKISSQVISTIEFLQYVRNTYDKGEDSATDSIFNALCTVGILVLDDIGRERHRREYPGEVSWAEEQLDRLIDTRKANGKPIIFTSNMDVGDLPIQSRLKSRILEVVEVIKFPDVDFRVTKRI